MVGNNLPTILKLDLAIVEQHWGRAVQRHDDTRPILAPRFNPAAIADVKRSNHGVTKK
jgi:hypothetical protein